MVLWGLGFGPAIVVYIYKLTRPIKFKFVNWHYPTGAPRKQGILSTDDELRFSLNLVLKESISTITVMVVHPEGTTVTCLEERDGITLSSTDKIYSIKIVRGLTVDWILYCSLEADVNNLPEEFQLEIKQRVGNSRTKGLCKKRVYFNRRGSP